MSGGSIENGAMSPFRNDALSMPAFDRGRRHAELSGHRPDAAELVEDASLIHGPLYVREPHRAQAECVRQSHSMCNRENRTQRRMDAGAIIAGLKRLGVPHDRIADAIGRDRTAATRMLGGTRSLKMHEAPALEALIAEFEQDAGEIEHSVRPDAGTDHTRNGLVEDYCAVDILPSFAGMGGGGTGQGDRQQALLPRALIEGELRAQASDLLLIEVRGTSMEPDFKQGDRILIDRRDTDTRQGGPFALFDGDTYVLKNVEHLPGPDGKMRVFATNRLFSDWYPAPGEARIEGRPVWFARRL